MKHRLLSIGLAVLAMLLSPFSVMAQEEAKYYDARLEGYPSNVTLELGSPALTWLLFVFLTIICIGVMFKNARRTHLD